MSAVEGIQFPANQEGRRSSGAAARAIFAAALGAASAQAAQAAQAETNWRGHYPQHVRRLVELSLGQPQHALAIAQAGLDAAWQTFEFWRDGEPLSLAAAMAAPADAGLRTALVAGRDTGPPARWELPYQGRLLHGDTLARQIEAWERAGVVEPSHADALRLVQRNPAWFDLSDRTLVLLGAASEAGPLPWLLRWRANVVAVDVPRAATWSALIARALAGNGRLLAPVAAATDDLGDPDRWQARAGCDLLTQTPEIAAWLCGLGADLDIATLAYLDGERHLRVALAMDAVVGTLSAAAPRTSLCSMATPTDVFAVPEALAGSVLAAYERRPLLTRAAQATARAASGGRLFAPHIQRLLTSDNGARYGIVDCLILQQGPNYALAKRIQQWRALVARNSGQWVAINVAPSTATQSVTRHAGLAAGFRGAHAFGVEVFAPATTSALIAALWVHDLRNPQSAANPAVALAHPLELLMRGANHGGLWRVPYLPRSVLPLAALVGLMARPRPTA
jgi:hypothetical protein